MACASNLLCACGKCFAGHGLCLKLTVCVWQVSVGQVCSIVDADARIVHTEVARRWFGPLPVSDYNWT